MTLLNIFHSGGLWLIPLICLGGAIFAYSKASQKAKQKGLSIWQVGETFFVVVLTLAFIITLIWIASDYKGV